MASNVHKPPRCTIQIETYAAMESDFQPRLFKCVFHREGVKMERFRQEIFGSHLNARSNTLNFNRIENEVKQLVKG